MNIAFILLLLTFIRITLGFEGKAPSIYLNASMFTQIIRDPASSTEEMSTRFFK